MDYLSGTVPKSDKTKRVEVHLMPSVVKGLQRLADKENRSLKNYIETVLIQHVQEAKEKIQPIVDRINKK